MEISLVFCRVISFAKLGPRLGLAVNLIYSNKIPMNSRMISKECIESDTHNGTETNMFLA